MTAVSMRDYEGLWWLAQAVHADLRERSAANYSLIAGVAFAVVAVFLFLLAEVSQRSLEAEEAIADLKIIISLLLALIGLLWWSAFWAHRRVRFDHLDVQSRAYSAGYSVDGRRGCWSKVPRAVVP